MCSASDSTAAAFALKAAAEAAAEVLADRRFFALDEAGWQAFDRALERPAAEVPGLRELLSSPTVLGPGVSDRAVLDRPDGGA